MKSVHIHRVAHHRAQNRPVTQWIIWLSFCGLLNACSVGPKYHRPAVALAPAYKESGDWKQAEPKDTIVRGQWWEIFQDPQLNDLESRIDRGNHTIAAAAANYEAARALVREARSQYFPCSHNKPGHHEFKSLHHCHSWNR